jgi:imidazolonepropionase
MAREAQEIDATGRVILPGFVDAHTRLCGAPAPNECEVEESVWTAHVRGDPFSPNSTSRKRLEFRARRWIEAMVRHGTTTLAAESEGASSGVMKRLRMLAGLDGMPLDVVSVLPVRPEPSEPGTEESGERGLFELMTKIRTRNLARFVDLYWPSDAALKERARRIVESAHRLGFLLKVRDHSGSEATGLRMAVESGAVSVDCVEDAGEDDIVALAASGTMATVVPAREFHECRLRFAPVRKMVDSGAAIALGTGFHPSLAPTLSMQTVISLACMRLRLTPEEAISAATINAAHALRCAGRTGSLEYGKAADLVMLDTADYRDLACHFGRNMVALTIKRGEVIYEQGGVQRTSWYALKPTA